MNTVNREILLSFWKVHILHHASEEPIHGQWILNELAWSIVIRVLCSLPAALAVIGTIGDWRRHVRHDFMHWAGIAVVVTMAVIEWPVWIVWRFLFR